MVQRFLELFLVNQLFYNSLAQFFYRNVNLLSFERAVNFLKCLDSHTHFRTYIQVLRISFDLSSLDRPQDFWCLWSTHASSMTSLRCLGICFTHTDSQPLGRFFHLGGGATCFPSSLVQLHLLPIQLEYREEDYSDEYSDEDTEEGGSDSDREEGGSDNEDADDDSASDGQPDDFSDQDSTAADWTEKKDFGPWESPSWSITLALFPQIHFLIVTTPRYLIWPPTEDVFAAVRQRWTRSLSERHQLSKIIIHWGYAMHDDDDRFTQFNQPTTTEQQYAHILGCIAGGRLGGMISVWEKIEENGWSAAKSRGYRPADADLSLLDCDGFDYTMFDDVDEDKSCLITTRKDYAQSEMVAYKHAQVHYQRSFDRGFF